MDPVTREYDITPKPAGSTTAWQRWRARCARLVLLFLLALLVQWAADTFIFHSTRKGWVDLLNMPVVMALVLTFFPFRRHILILLTVGQDFVERRMKTGSLNLKKRISRQDAKAVYETTLHPGTSHATRGLAVRDRGPLGSWMLGYVFIPETIPDYDEVKTRLIGWISK